MNPADRFLLFAISESEPASFADISVRTRMATVFLGSKLTDLIDRGFVRFNENRYSLAKGVREHILETTERSAVNT